MSLESEASKAGRRGKFWKQMALTPAQEQLVRQHMNDKRWKFQTLAEEAFRAYFLGNGKPWPRGDNSEPQEKAS